MTSNEKLVWAVVLAMRAPGRVIAAHEYVSIADDMLEEMRRDA